MMTRKTFDAVKMMRELRDKLSEELMGMSAEERIRYIREQAATTPLGKRLTHKAVQGKPKSRS